MAERNRMSAGYICTTCAERLGAIWPQHHVATMHTGRCPQCGMLASLAALDDWDWPKYSCRPQGFGGGRD